MRQQTVVPIPPDLSARYSRSSAGRAWLASLPGLLQGRLEHWELEADLAPGVLPWNGHGGVVVPVRRIDGTPAALKIAFPHDEARVERHALALWRGRGAVRLLESDAGTCAMLLERLDAAQSLQTVPMDDAVTVWGTLMRQLSLVPDERPQWQEFATSPRGPSNGVMTCPQTGNSRDARFRAGSWKQPSKSARPVVPSAAARDEMSWCTPTSIS